MSGDAPRYVNHLADTEAAPVAQVVDELAGALFARAPQSIQGENMRRRQIAHMNVVADAGPVFRGVISAKDLDALEAAEGDVEHARDEVRFGLVGFSFGRAG